MQPFLYSRCFGTQTEQILMKMGSYQITQRGLDALCCVLAMELEHDTKRERESVHDHPFYLWCDITTQRTVGCTYAQNKVLNKQHFPTHVFMVCTLEVICIIQSQGRDIQKESARVCARACTCICVCGFCVWRHMHSK